MTEPVSSQPSIPSLGQRRILLAVTGGIAAYKAAELTSRLRKGGTEVRVAMTHGATEFVTALTFEALAGHPVYSSIFDQPEAFAMEHIGWARWGEALVIAPASANTLARLAHGLADDAVTTLALAYTGPIWLAPSMNTAMWENPVTQANVALLRRRGMRVIEPGSGGLACGEVGAGRMAEPQEIIDILTAELAGASAGTRSSAAANPDFFEPAADPSSKPAAPAPVSLAAADRSLAGRTVLVTTGPTREAIDPVRFLSNRSSGKMGCALAEAARLRGARVILAHGPLAIDPPAGVELHPIESARELLAKVQEMWPEVDIAIFAAAVSNYESARPANQKIKAAVSLTLELNRTPDIASWCGEHRRSGQILVGFAAETQDLMDAARRKIRQKRLDLICANDVSRPGLGFAAADNQVTLLDADGNLFDSPHLPKKDLAGWIWNHVQKHCIDAGT